MNDRDLPERPLTPPDPEKPVECPVCGRHCFKIVHQGGFDGPVVGCETCLYTEDAEDYRLEMIEAGFGEDDET